MHTLVVSVQVGIVPCQRQTLKVRPGVASAALLAGFRPRKGLPISLAPQLAP